MSMKNWSTTAASNATVDSINFAEGQAPSTVNDSARAMMADVRYELATQDTIASATTTDLGSKDAGSLTVSGTTTITGFGTVSAGIRKLLTFSGALTLTHNGTSLILPGAANITTVAGDSCIAESLGSGNWKVHSFQRISNAPAVYGTGVATALAVNVGSAGAPVVNGGALGTPSSGVATNLTGTAAGLTAGTASAVAVGGITGLGTGVATALAINVGSAGAPVTFNGALGTPSSGTVTNLTGTASININGTVGATTPTTGAFTTVRSTAPNSATNGIILFTNAGGSAVYSAKGNQTVSSGENPTNCALWVEQDSTSGRSINAAGTINASGADYAEYENNNGLTIAKGEIVGFKADGTLTKTFSEAIRFGVKSTNPSYVGGDTWGAESSVGERPADLPGDATEEQIAANAAEWTAFNAKLEAARALVDRIAYSGKVPCNVTGATPGDYIVATNDNGSIKGGAVSAPTFEQYRLAVGRVNRILPDGRAEIAVLVH